MDFLCAAPAFPIVKTKLMSLRGRRVNSPGTHSGQLQRGFPVSWPVAPLPLVCGPCRGVLLHSVLHG